MTNKRVSPNGAIFYGQPHPYPISSVVRAGDFVITSALGDRVRTPTDDALDVGDAAFEREARGTFKEIQDALALAGATLSDVIDCQVWLRDPADFPLMNRVFVEHFGETQPTRQVFQNQFMFGFRIELRVMAYTPLKERQ
jgi:enamine deaminase RidA (YjgF/YER057c/UK114 family)